MLLNSYYFFLTGYTFVVTAYTENIVPAGKFKLRLIGERNPLPVLSKEGTIGSSFFVNETRDYYIPNKYGRIFRYHCYTSSRHATLFQRSSNVIWTSRTLDGRYLDVLCWLGFSRGQSMGSRDMFFTT